VENEKSSLRGALLPARPEYLALQSPEEVLEPKLEIIDSHHHLWDVKGHHSDMLRGESDRYLVEEYARDVGTGHNVVASVFLECHAMYRAEGDPRYKSVGEVEFAAGMAAMAESGAYGKTHTAAAIVGQADMNLGAEVTPVLEAHVRAGGGRFRGIRHSAGWTDDPSVRLSKTARGPGQYLKPEFHEGVRALSRVGLTLDAFLFHHQLIDVVKLARAVPEAKIALCHCGGPLGFSTDRAHQKQIYQLWKANMTEVARCENVSVKLGGMLIRLNAFDYVSEAAKPPTSQELARLWGPFIETTIELFGADRCMFESNFPVEKMGVSFPVLWNAFKRITSSASEAEKVDLYAGTARRFYQMP
jgi:predicted TIM-barrel fold metal-dependent hydrolase